MCDSLPTLESQWAFTFTQCGIIDKVSPSKKHQFLRLCRGTTLDYMLNDVIVDSDEYYVG